jgi:hypothetical protein
MTGFPFHRMLNLPSSLIQAMTKGNGIKHPYLLGGVVVMKGKTYRVQLTKDEEKQLKDIVSKDYIRYGR